MARVRIGNVYPTHEYLMERCAPAGFGLGGNGKLVEISSISDIDPLSNNGWYAIHSGNNISVAGFSFSTCLLEISMLTENHGWHILRFPGKTSTLIRCKNNGVWSEWDWEKPPMDIGVEYRTTERYMGKPVYTTLVDCGNMPNATIKGVVHGLNVVIPIRCSGQYESSHTIPNLLPEEQCAVSFDKSKIYINCTKDLSKSYVYVQLWYTKT